MGDQPFHVISNNEVWAMLSKVDDDVNEIKGDVASLKRGHDDHETRIRSTESRKRIEAKDIMIIIAVIGGTAATQIMRAIGVG
jgi:hypothetical protein